MDTDRDGCPDVRELKNDAGSATAGGMRSAKYSWDFYDVWIQPSPFSDPGFWTRDRVVTVADVLAVARRFGVSRPGGAPDKATARVEALTPPATTTDTEYHTALDRGPLIGPNAWNLGPPDGFISVVVDILGVARQFGHSCL
jgi:hypothetical protein